MKAGVFLWSDRSVGDVEWPRLWVMPTSEGFSAVSTGIRSPELRSARRVWLKVFHKPSGDVRRVGLVEPFQGPILLCIGPGVRRGWRRRWAGESHAVGVGSLPVFLVMNACGASRGNPRRRRRRGGLASILQGRGDRCRRRARRSTEFGPISVTGTTRCRLRCRWCDCDRGAGSSNENEHLRMACCVVRVRCSIARSRQC